MSLYLESRKINEAKKFLSKFHSQLMKIAKTGVVSKKTASRKISRVTKKINNSKQFSNLVKDIINKGAETLYLAIYNSNNQRSYITVKLK